MRKVIQNKLNNINFSNIYNIYGYIKLNHNIRFAGIISSILLLFIFALSAFPIIPRNNLVEAAPGTTSTTSLNMTLGHSAANLDLVVRSESGTFASSNDSDLASFNVSTNNYTGYTLSIAGSDDNGELSNGEGISFSSVSIATDAYTFTNGSSSAYNGKWGYLPSKYNSADNTNFLPSPTTSASTLNVTSCANGEPTTTCPNNQAEDNYTIGLGARADYTTKAGTYTNTFILTAVGNPVGYTINYADNSGDSTVANLPSATSSAISGTTTSTIVNLTTDVPTRTRYAFQYWCLGTVSDNGTVCNGTRYDSGSEFGISQIEETITTLYAVWKLNAYDITIKTNTGISKVTLNGTECTSTSGCIVTGLISGQSYTLTATAATGYTFSSWNAGSYGSVAANSTSTTYTVGAGNSAITPSASPNKYNITIKTATGISSVSLNGTSCTSTSGCTVSNLEYGKSYTLTASYATSSYNFGSWSVSGSGSVASTSSANTTFTVGAGTATITPSASSCTNTISGTMQTYTTAVSSLCMGASGTLTDNRDNQTYTVAKINNMIWMTRNLAIGCNGSGSTYGPSTSRKSLTSSTSNVSATWSTPTTSLTSGDSYDDPRMTCNATYGAWYNYAAATAGTITGSSNSTEASYSVCPAGWRLPTNSEQSGITSSASAFSPVTGGYYRNGSLSYTGYGYWWSSTAFNTTRRYYLFWDGSSLGTFDYFRRYDGIYIRCVHS